MRIVAPKPWQQHKQRALCTAVAFTLCTTGYCDGACMECADVKSGYAQVRRTAQLQHTNDHQSNQCTVQLTQHLLQQQVNHTSLTNKSINSSNQSRSIIHDGALTPFDSWLTKPVPHDTCSCSKQHLTLCRCSKATQTPSPR